MRILQIKRDQNYDACMIGPFPPPVHGQALSNAVIKDKLQEKGGNIFVINLSSSSLNRAWYIRLRRVTEVTKGLFSYFSILLNSNCERVYISLSGGYGQMYDIAFLFIARLFGKKLFLHHRSYAYLDTPTFISRILLGISGRNTTHFVLCNNMGNKLKQNYPVCTKISVISNAVILEQQSSQPVKRMALNTIGFLSNISHAKGIVDFLDVMSELEKIGETVSALIAGPFENPSFENQIKDRIQQLKSVQYVGPKYGRDKVDFFREIDVLLFPTRYVNEAEPRTIHEALSNGVPVIAYSRGCISSIITPESGIVVQQNQDFVKIASQQIQSWCASPAQFSEASRQAQKRFSELYRINQNNLDKMCEELLVN